MTHTLGSLFDGAGGFPLAGSAAGFTPVWASEIEPFPIRVTSKRLPRMKHLGDITALDGRRISPVDVITFGSPCQDLSVAGRREGLTGECSGLFREAIRIIREMREQTNGRQPKYIVWENVPGAFSSNRGEDFRTVLEETAKIKDSGISIPRPEDGKWLPAGEIVGDGYSIAWRVYDAQHWGVPQRRKRIYLVADFTGGRAGKIQFERESLCGNPAQGRGKGKGPAGSPETNSGTASARVFEKHSQASRCRELGDICETVTAKYGTGGNNMPIVVEDAVFSIGRDYKTMTAGKAGTLTNSDVQQMVVLPYSIGNGQVHDLGLDEKAKTLSCMHDQQAVIQGYPYRARRLTPLECGRLQGYPDWWTEAIETPEPTDAEVNEWTAVFEMHRKSAAPETKPKTKAYVRRWLRHPHNDSAEYRMWGNSLAIPCAYTVLAGIAEALTEVERKGENGWT